MKPTVVLLHGLARTHRSLGRLRREIERAGYPTWARSYPTRRMGLEDLSLWVARRLREDLGDAELFAVTHSLGGVVARCTTGLLPWRGAVMLAPPNRGSRVAGAFSRRPLLGWCLGPTVRALTRPDDWPVPACPFAVIAGTRRVSAFAPPSWLTAALSLLPPGEPSDGTITVEETRLDGMADFATVPASHAWIASHPAVPPLVLAFLRHGRFRAGT